MPAEVYTLKWQFFYQGLTNSFKELRKDDDFNDITLSFDDDKFIEANGTMLAACSPVFKRIIKRNKSKQAGQQIIYLSDISSDHMKLLIDFMYNGEIKILQSKIEPFLRAANKLKVKGLASEDTSNNANNGSNDQPSSPTDVSQGKITSHHF